MRTSGLLLTLLLTGACASDEPVLSGVPEPGAATAGSDAPEAEGASELSAPLLTEQQPKAYQRAEGVIIDVRFLGGKAYKEVRDILADQLGPLLSSADLPADGGREMVFERGTLRLVDDQIIRVRVPLEPPLRRTAALAATGFPPATGRYVTLHREYRLNHEWGFRRIRLMRENRSSELVNVVDAWVRVPGEQSAQR